MKLNLRAFATILIFASVHLSYSQDAHPSWLDVPFVQQAKAGCGSAAVAMVIEYWARQFPGLDKAQADAEKINQLLPATSPKGIQGEALKQYLDARGFQAFIFEGEMSDLRNHLSKGRPVIVCLAPKGKAGPLHYAVVAGLDDRDVWMNDPARGKLFREDVERFTTEWQRTNNWALLAVPRSAQ
jgi:predicted double-glycine peptidase